MSDQPSMTASPIVRYVPAGYLIVTFLWRVATPAQEYPGRFSTYLEMTLDALVIAGVIAIRARVPKPLFWLAMIAGVGLFAIRLNGTASWWTGHLFYSLPPR
ncbi:MAG: hypothetical protein JWR80_4041 [Bradyrhizobium sp.]|nr:hypothetical protein [Bradyrhizobium sp.]